MNFVAYHAIVPAEMAGCSGLSRLYIGILPFILPKRQETQSATVRKDDKGYFSRQRVSMWMSVCRSRGVPVPVIRPNIQPKWPDWSGTTSQIGYHDNFCDISGIPQQIPQSLRDSGDISEAT
jgi:hypothetical protein